MTHETCNKEFKLIVTIVKKGWSDTVVKASRKAGAKGGTIISGRGTGAHEQKTFFGMLLEPEKEIVLTIAESKDVEKIVECIMMDAKISIPGHGLGFVVPIENIFGTAHMLSGSYEEDKD